MERQDLISPDRNKDRMLVNAAFEAAGNHQARLGANFMLSALSGGQAIRFANSLIKHARLMESDGGKLANSSSGMHKHLWISVWRRRSMFLGAAMAQRDVSVVDEKGKLIVKNATCLEAWTIDVDNDGLRDLYTAGLPIAEELADGQPVFSIESVEDPSEKQSRVAAFFKTQPSYDDGIQRAIGEAYADTVNTRPQMMQRTDMPDQGLVYARIYYNHPIDLKTA